MTEFKNGSVKISNIIIDQLIAESALKVEGVKTVIGYNGERVDTKRKDSIKSEITNNEISISLSVILNTDQKIYEIAESVQNTIREQIKVMLNLDANDIEVSIRDLELTK